MREACAVLCCDVCVWCAQVRGAYVKLERARAAELGYEDPIWQNIDATHKNFDRCLDAILDEVRSLGGLRECCITHTGTMNAHLSYTMAYQGTPMCISLCMLHVFAHHGLQQCPGDAPSRHRDLQQLKPRCCDVLSYAGCCSWLSCDGCIAQPEVHRAHCGRHGRSWAVASWQWRLLWSAAGHE